MNQHEFVARAQESLGREFRWHDGHADMWRLFEDAVAFDNICAGLASLAATLRPTRVAGIESRGFLLGGAVARDLGVGFHAIRKTDGLFAGDTISTTAAPDYRDRAHTMRLRRTLGPDDRVVLVDDWIERGSQARAARELIESTGATWLGAVVVVDDADDLGRGGLGPVLSIVTSRQLPADAS